MSQQTSTSQPGVIRATFTRQGNLTLLLMTGRNCTAEPVYANYEGMKAVIRLNPEVEFAITILERIPATHP